MEANAYRLGNLDAIQAMGFTKHAYSWTQAIAPVAGATIGAIADPDSALRGAALGGLTAAGAQHTLGRITPSSLRTPVPVQTNRPAVILQAPPEALARYKEPMPAEIHDAMARFLEANPDFVRTKKAWAKAIAPLLGAAAGYVAAPEGEGVQGAALGGLGALGLQSAALGLKGTFPRKAGAAPVPASVQTPTPGGTTVFPKGAPVPISAIPASIHNAAQQHDVDPQELYARRMQQVQTRSPASLPAVTPELLAASKHFGTDPALVLQMMNKPGPMHGATPLGIPQVTPTPVTKHEPQVAAMANRFKPAMDLSGNIGIPGLASVGVGHRNSQDRLPGMSRWAPHDTIERGFDYTDSGMDPQAVANLEADRGTLTHPLLGAALAAAGAAHFFPKSGITGPVVAGLLGGGMGSLYNQATRGRRVEEGLEAFQGAQRERGRFPLQRHPVQTANEAPPLTVSSGNGEM